MTIDNPIPIPATFDTPRGWRLLRRSGDGGSWRAPGGLIVIASMERHSDTRQWCHMSMSGPGRLPTWRELVMMRDALVGADVECYQVIPPQSRYVNIHPNVLHLYACVDSPDGVLPQFHGVIGGQVTI